MGTRPLAGTGPQRRAGREGTRSHTKSWAEGRRHRSQHVAAAWAPPIMADLPRRIGAQPVAAQITRRIHALNREPRQILHRYFPPAVRAQRLPQPHFTGKSRNTGKIPTEQKTE